MRRDIWYHAVCDEHKTICDIFVTSPSRTAQFLSGRDMDIQLWFETHEKCKLRLVHTEEEINEISSTHKHVTRTFNGENS